MDRILALALIIAYVVIFYYIVYVKKRKKKKAQENLFSKLAPGVRVVTISGIYGTLTEVNDKDVILEVCCEEGKTIKARAVKGAIKEVR